MGRIDITEYIEQVYKDTSSYLIKYITLKCRSTEDIQDILQNTYLGFLDTISKNGHAGIFNPKHYLLRIAKKEIAKFYEHKTAHDTVVVASTDDENYVEKALDEFLEQNYTGDTGFSVEMFSLIEGLGPLATKIFTLRFVYDETIDSIAKQLGITPSNVKNHLYRGLKALKEQMLCEK